MKQEGENVKKGLRLFGQFLVVLILLISSFLYPIPTKADNTPSVDLLVTPSANELTLNADGEAAASLNIAITPNGVINAQEREPIDVVFIHDTSGSMDDYLEKKKKSVSAQEALLDAINYFKEHNKKDDSFYFIPFNDNVRTTGDVKVTEGLNEIENMAKKLDKSKNNVGGTNYTQTLEYAKSLLEKSKNKNKYIIFLTDGEPTVLQKGKWKYTLYTNGKALYEGKTSSKYYAKTKALIHETALQTSNELSEKNIRMYSIGFAKEDEIDFQLLENMAMKTGGYAVRATPDSLTKIFQEISKKIDSYTINGEVTVDLQKFGGNVIVDSTSNAVIDDKQVAHIPFSFNFPVGQQPVPSNINITLPLIFKQAGIYTFDNIKIQYNEQTPISHPSFDIKINKDANAFPGAIFSAKPSAEEFIKPPKGNAKGNIDVTITPKGMAPRDERLPIDVVFVHDTSGSMAYEWGGVRRDTTAKNALISAIEYFEEYAKDQDKFFFVPFDSDVSNKELTENLIKVIGTIKPVEGLSKIKSTANLLDYSDRFLIFPSVASKGGTNYNAALNEAMKKFGNDSKRNKYIVFLTDGEPTELSYNNNYYTIYSDNTAKINNKSAKLQDVKSIINQQALNLSSTIGNNGITMYNIGFADEDDVDFELLKNMSSRTGGYAIQGNSSNLTSIFNDISKKVNSTTISGNVTIDLTKFNGDVIADPTSNFQEKNGIVQIPFKITFPVGEKPDPSFIEQSLPLQFKKAGTYEFKNNITMTYTDINGSNKTVTSDPFTVNVKEETAPYFLNEVDIMGNKNYPPDGLEKDGDKDTESNEFTVAYKLIPDTVFTEITKGTISEMKIIQPLPDGISLANTNQIELYQNGDNKISGASVNINEDEKTVEISLENNTINYESGKFSIDDFTVKLKLKADWALPFTVLPQATLNFYDSRFENQQQTLNIDEQRISMNVRLDGSDCLYFGDYLGFIQKVDNNTGEILAETQLLSDNTPIQKPVKAMKFINGEKAIEVTYNDDTKAVLLLKTDFMLKNLSLSEEIQSGATTKGKVGFKITDYVAGDNVVYEYQLIVDNEKTEWKSFDPTTFIELSKDLDGLVEIRVRTKGGFTVDSKPVIKTVTIIKESIQVEPNPIVLNMGDSLDVHLSVTPDDGTERVFDVSILNGSIAKYENGKIIGLKDGETKLIVTTVDIAGDEIRKEVKIKVNPILISRITVSPNPVKIKKFLNFSDFIIDIKPSNASNKNLVWKSLNQSIVSIVEPGIIYGKATGTAEIEIRANDGSDAKTTIEVIVGSPLTGISVPDELVIEKGTTDKNVNDYLIYHPSDATNIKGAPTFSSTNQNILEVETDGEIIPKRIGNAAIDIKVKDEDNNTFTARLKVKVVDKKTDGNHDKDKY